MKSVVNDFVIGSFKEFIHCPLTWAAGQAIAEADSTSVSASRSALFDWFYCHKVNAVTLILNNFHYFCITIQHD